MPTLSPPSHDEIALVAYALWEENNKPLDEESALAFWIAGEELLILEYNIKVAEEAPTV
jgi:Protein of unknown function (DUF2934)